MDDILKNNIYRDYLMTLGDKTPAYLRPKQDANVTPRTALDRKASGDIAETIVTPRTALDRKAPATLTEIAKESTDKVFADKLAAGEKEGMPVERTIPTGG
jgi:hypothetical protein